MADPKAPPIRFENLASVLEQKLDHEAAILDVLVAALGRGDDTEPAWAALHAAALRDDRLAELAFSYERLSRDKKLKSLTPAQQAVALSHAGTFFADVFGDADGAEGYLERALTLAPGEEHAFEKYAALLTQKKDLRRLGELYAAAAPHRGDKPAQLDLLRRGVSLVEADPERALRLNQEILKLDPGDGRAKAAVAALYEKTGRLAELAKLLEQSLAADPPPAGEEARASRLKLLSLYAGPLGEIERALPHVEEVLRFDPVHEGARRVAEELLGHKLLTARVASALSRALEEAGEPAEAARLLGIEIEALRGPKRIEAQKRLSKLTLEQLGDLEKAYSIDEAIVPLDPADEEVRTRFVKLASALDKQLEATRALTRAATGTRDAAMRARIGADMGDLYRELGDAKKARASYQSVIDAATDAQATLRSARALKALSTEPRDPRALVAALGALAEIEPEEEARLDALAEIGAVAEQELGDLAGAVAAWERLRETTREGEALAALGRLYEAKGAWASLVAVLETQAPREEDAGRARELAFRAADLRATKLPDRAAALAAFRAWVRRYGATREALSRIIPLLEHERSWEELGRALDADVALAPEAERAPLFARLGVLRQTRLDDTSGALAAHSQALALDPAERTSRPAVEKLLAEGELRLAAAEVLEPIARAEANPATLVRVLSARAALVDDAASRLAALAEAAELSLAGLRDARKALDFAARGLSEALAGALVEVPAWIERVERISAGDLGRRAAVLREALGERHVEGEILGLLARRAGEALVAAGDVAGALSVFRRALAQAPLSPELLGRVDALLREQGSPEERIALHRAALAKAEDPGRRRELLHAIGAIERRDLRSPAAATATYRVALVEDPADRVAFEALVEVLTAEGAWEDLYAELVQGRARASGEERAALLLRLAEVSAARGWTARAAEHHGEILDGGAALGDEVLGAAERAARAQGDVGLLRRVIERRVDGAVDPLESAAWLTRLGELLAESFADPAGAADAFRRAASAAELVAENALAARLHERVLAALPDDRAAAERLLALYTEAEAWDRLPPVYGALLRTAPDAAGAARTLIAFEAPAVRAGAGERFLAEAEAWLARAGDLDPADRAAVRSARARVLALDPARFADAAAAYRELLEAEDDERSAAARAFDAFLAQRGPEAVVERRWLFAHRVERAPEPERAPILVAWAGAERADFGDPAAAVALYERASAAEPENDDILAALFHLRLERGDFAGAAVALEHRRALSEGGARAALDLELAALLLDRLGRPGEAIEAVAPVLEANPQDQAARALLARALDRAVADDSEGGRAARRRAADLFERVADAAEDADGYVAVIGLLLATPAGDAELGSSRRGWFERILDRRGLPPERALEVAVRAAAELPEDAALWDRAEQLAREQKKPAPVAEAYRRALGVVLRGSAAPALDPLAAQSGEVIEEIGRRAVDHQEEWFDEPETVVALLRQVFEMAPASTWAFERLKLVYNLAERYEDLFALYDEAIARADDRETRRDLLEDAALAAKDLASDPERAIRYYAALFALRPDPRVRSALERLYERHGRHRELCGLLTAELPALEHEAAQKQRARVAALWLDGAGEAEPAVAVVEEMIDADPAGDHREAFDLLERVMQRTAASPGEARRRAAARLKDRYRAEGRADDLVRVLEIDLDAAATPAERAERLLAIVRLRRDSLGDEAGAFEGLAALVTLAPGVAEHRVELGRLGRKLGRTARLAEVLAAAAARAEGDTRVELLGQAAEAYEGELGDAARALELRRQILASPASDEAHLAAARDVDRLLAAAGRDAERAEVLERLAELEQEPAARRAARAELSRLSLLAGDAERAVRAFRAALAEDPTDAEAEEGLCHALDEAGRYEELVEALTKRAARGGERARPDRVRVARLLEHPLGDLDAATAAWIEVRGTFGRDDESADALGSLLERRGRVAELAALLEAEATGAAEPARAADLFRRLGDLHRAQPGHIEDAVAAYDLALEQRADDPGARRGLSALVGALDAADPATRRALQGAVASLSRVYGAADDFGAMIDLLEPRLLAAESDADRVAILGETAALAERRAGDAVGAFAAILRAFRLAPSEALSAKLTRLADAADRWSDVADVLAEGLLARAALPAAAARDLWWRVALWQRDGRADPAAAEAALREAAALAPDSAEIFAALAELQRRAPGRELITTLLRLAEIEGGSPARYREAVEVAERDVGDAALAKTLAEKLLDLVSERWGAGAAEAASWALEALARLLDEGERGALADLFLRGARLPFDAGERRQLRLRAAELSAEDATIGIYEELFAEDPGDAVVSGRLDAIYRERGRVPALIALRERQIAVAAGERRAELCLDLARLLVESGDRDRAITVLEENLATPHAVSRALLAELYEATARHGALVALVEEAAAAAEADGDAAGALAGWTRAAALAEERLGDTARAITAHRRAAALGATASEAALARLFAARGEHGAAAEVLSRICARTPPEALAEPALRLVEALRAAGKPASARAELERALTLTRGAAGLRERLAALYRETGEWGALAALLVDDAGKAGDGAARAGKLREAAELYLGRARDPGAAVPLLAQAAALTPDDPAILLKLASARRAQGDHEGAAATLRDVIAAYGNRRPKERALVHFELAQVALGKNERARALGELDAALRIDPAHPQILQAMARLSFEEGQLERASRTYRALLMVVRRPRGAEAEPGSADDVSRAEVLFELSEIARLRGENERAAEQLESAFEAAREGEGERERLLAALRSRGRHEVLARALSARLPEVSGAAAAVILEELGDLYEAHLGRAADALEARLAALALAPPSDEALSRALALAAREGQIERWVAVVTKLSDAEPAAARAVDLRLLVGRALGDGARAAEAYAHAELLAGADPALAHRLPEIWKALQAVYAKLGDAAAEEALLERRIAAGSEDPTAAADALYLLAGLRLRRPEAEYDGLELLARAFDADAQPDRAEGLLREALARGADGVSVGHALADVARRSGRERALVDALVLISGVDAEITHVEDANEARLDPIREAVEIAERMGDGVLVEELLRKALQRAPLLGDPPLAWALAALAERRAAVGDLVEAADLKERAARGAPPEKERSILLEVAALCAGALADLPRAARLYEDLRAREPAEHEIWQPLAEVYRRLGDRARLAALLEETAPLLEGAAERARLRLERARMAVDEDQEKAVALLKEVIEESPGEGDAAAVLAELLEKLGRRDELAALIQRQLDAAKDREDKVGIVELTLKLGTLLEQQWDEQGALDAYHAALDWDPKSRVLLRQIVRVGMGRDDALALGDALEQLLSVEEGEAAVALALQLAALRGEHGDPDGAARALEQGWAALPGEPRLKHELTRLYTEAGAFKKLADLHVREAATLADKAAQVECLARAAELYREEAADLPAAAEALGRALELAPHNRDVLIALVDVHGAMGFHERAVLAVGRALDEDPNDPWLYRARASLHEALGRDSAALLDLEQAYEKSGGGYAGELVTALGKAAASAPPGPTQRGLRLRLAEVLAKAGEAERARAELTELTRADGRDRGALRALAALEEGTERWDAASAVYRRLIAIEDGEALCEAALRLAECCARCERLGDARAALERAHRTRPGDAAVRDKLREVYNVTGAARELAGLILEDAARAPDVPGRFALLMQAGRLLLAEGEHEQATAVLGEAKSLRPEDMEATTLLADALAYAGRAGEARAFLDAAVAAQKGRRSKALAGVLRRVARLDLGAGDRGAALASLARAFDNDPQNGQLAMELGALAVEHDDQDLATRAFRAVTLMKSVPTASSEGVTTQLRAVAYYHLGRMAYLQGDRRKARLMIDKAVADDPTLDAARALLDQLRAG
jgi:tetratricopeptide (TPR) repeat protein